MKRLPWLAPLLLALLLIPAPPGDVVPAFARVRGIAPLAAGVHAPNRAWREQDYARVALGHFDTVKMMSYHPPEAYARLRQENARLRFVVRLNTPWNELPPPARFVKDNAPYLNLLVGAGYEPWVEIGNEPNLELHPGAARAFAAWYRQVLDALRAEVPAARYGFPGLAQDQREDEWLEANADLIRDSNWLGVHAYWNTEREMLDPQHGLKLAAIHQRFPNLPLVITEAGNQADGVPAAQRAEQYARFVRTVARLPYVRAVYFFILSGTPEWQRFFFDDSMLGALRDTSREPAPLLDGLADLRRYVTAEMGMLFAAPSVLPKPAVAGVATPAPTPPPLTRRRLLVDASPPTLSPAGGSSSLWVPLLAGEGSGGVRSASDFLATDLSARLELEPFATVSRGPLAVQLAERDLLGPAAGGVAEPAATGFALLWDDDRWRLRYYRDGALSADVALAAAPGPAVGDEADGRTPLEIELAIERRSAAAWIWPAGQPQPATPNAVFAPPEVAAEDGARPRALILPAARVANVVLEGATRW